MPFDDLRLSWWRRDAAATARPSPRANTPWLAAFALGLIAVLANGTSGGDRNPQPSSSTGGIVNPADDRARMQAQLEHINRSLDAIQASLEKGLRVEVVKMPAAPAAR